MESSTRALETTVLILLLFSVNLCVEEIWLLFFLCFRTLPLCLQYVVKFIINIHFSYMLIILILNGLKCSYGIIVAQSRLRFLFG